MPMRSIHYRLVNPQQSLKKEVWAVETIAASRSHVFKLVRHSAEWKQGTWEMIALGAKFQGNGGPEIKWNLGVKQVSLRRDVRLRQEEIKA